MTDMFTGIDEPNRIMTFTGDALELFLEKQLELKQSVDGVGDTDDVISSCLQALGELGFAVLSVDGADDSVLPLEEDEQAEVIVSSALIRRKNEGHPVLEASYAILSAEGHVLLLSLAHPETSSVVRAAA